MRNGLVRARPHILQPRQRFFRHGLERPSIISQPGQPTTRTSTRGAKTKTTIKLSELQQGLIQGDALQPPPQLLSPLSQSQEKESVIQQARNNIAKYPSCAVLTKVGSFYELYFEQAVEYSNLLSIKLASKRWGKGRVAMAGFPAIQLDRYLRILVLDLGRYVALCEEFRNGESEKRRTGLEFTRRVTRVVTPGTLVDEKFLDPWRNNFLLAVVSGVEVTAPEGGIEREEASNDEKEDVQVGLAWLDLSTGELFTQTSTIELLPALMSRIGPKEVVLRDDLDGEILDKILTGLKEDKSVVNIQSVKDLDMMASATMIENSEQLGLGYESTAVENGAIDLLCAYVKDKFRETVPRIQSPVRRKLSETMSIDRNSMRGLEILQTGREGIEGGRGCLLHAVRRTVTKGGARLLRDRISSPSTSLEVTNRRLDLVDFFVSDQPACEDMRDLLGRSSDSLRIIQGFALGRGDADALLRLAETIQATEEIAKRLAELAGAQRTADDPTRVSLKLLVSGFFLDEPAELAATILKCIDEEALSRRRSNESADASFIASKSQDVLNTEGEPEDVEALGQVMRARIENTTSDDSGDDNSWIMHKHASTNLGRLHSNLKRKHDLRRELEKELQVRAKADSLTLKWTPGHGHFCHVKGAKDVKASSEVFDFLRNVSMSKSTRSFYVPEWTVLGKEIDSIRAQIQAEEEKAFERLRQQVIRNLVKLRRNASVLDELDIACSFATLARECSLTRPLLNTGTTHKIVGGRHPSVMQGLEESGRSFVSNDCFVGEREQIWLITGPNMAGKSTFLRQNALISILAQVGSFVPAEYAEIGLVDQIFSRIGSADNLFQDQSTFMVEMMETAAILKHATPRSFVIMDEVGRGTTPQDGLAVAFACLHHLAKFNRSRTLFATHFHALADMTADWKELGRYCTDISVGHDGSFSYDHVLRPGVNHESHALKVARLAGMPEQAVSTAEEVLKSVPTPKKGHTVSPTERDTIEAG